MDETRAAFEQWWAGRVASDDAKAGAWAAWLYLTGNDTLAHQQRAPLLRWNPNTSRMEPYNAMDDLGMKK